MVACGDDPMPDEPASQEVETLQQANTTPCTPASGYDSCWEVDSSQVETWQSTLPNPDWRTVNSPSDPDIEYEVTIDAHELNGGIVPTASGQGHYAHLKDFLITRADLLGVPVGALEDHITIEIDGPSMKLDDNNVLTDDATGIFVFDALSDENGQIYIDNQNVTDDLIPQGIGHDDHYVEGSHQASGGTTSAFPPDDSTVLSSGHWAADYTFSTFWPGGDYQHPWHMSEISNISWGSNPPCAWLMTGTYPQITFERHCTEADKLAIVHHDYDHGVIPFQEVFDSSGYKTIHLSDPFQMDGCSLGDALFDGSESEYDDDVLYSDSGDHNSCVFGSP